MTRSQETQKNVDDFIISDMIINEPINKMPGTGASIIRTLKNHKIQRISDLYDKYLEKDCDKDRFAGWIMQLSSRARVGVIYDCLQGWHTQFGNSYNPLARSVNNTATTGPINRRASPRQPPRSAAPAATAATSAAPAATAATSAAPAATAATSAAPAATAATSVAPAATAATSVAPAARPARRAAPTARPARSARRSRNSAQKNYLEKIFRLLSDIHTDIRDIQSHI